MLHLWGLSLEERSYPGYLRFKKIQIISTYYSYFIDHFTVCQDRDRNLVIFQVLCQTFCSCTIQTILTVLHSFTNKTKLTDDMSVVPIDIYKALTRLITASRAGSNPHKWQSLDDTFYLHTVKLELYTPVSWMIQDRNPTIGDWNLCTLTYQP